MCHNMLVMLLHFALLIFGLIIMLRGADAFVDGAAALARRFHIPEIVIGLTIVAMGTSAPEASISIISAIQGTDGVAVGNILGSNIANILLILGATALFSTLSVTRNTIRYEIPFIAGITALLCLFGFYFGAISRTVAIIFLGLFLLFLGYLFVISSLNEPTKQPETTDELSNIKITLFIILGLIGLILGSNLTVNSATNIARTLNVSDRIIGLTMVAVGTSLPELVTCIIAATQKQSGIVIGNIVGSNIFNILFVLGITGLIQPIPFDSAFLTDGLIALSAIILLFLATVWRNRLNRVSGLIFLILYIIYIRSLVL